VQPAPCLTRIAEVDRIQPHIGEPACELRT
jgi:hypothetical protein